MSFAKVMSRGQLTLPKNIRRSAGIVPGDTVSLRLIGEGKIEITVLPQLRLEDALRRFRIESPIDLEKDRLAWQNRATEDVIEKTNLNKGGKHE